MLNIKLLMNLMLITSSYMHFFNVKQKWDQRCEFCDISQNNQNLDRKTRLIFIQSFRIVVKYYLNSLSNMKSGQSEIKIQCMLNTVSMQYAELIRTVDFKEKKSPKDSFTTKKICCSKSGLFEYVCGFIHCMFHCLYYMHIIYLHYLYCNVIVYLKKKNNDQFLHY